MAGRISSIQRIAVAIGFVVLSGIILLGLAIGVVVLPSNPLNLDAWFCVLIAVLGLASVFDYHRRRRRPRPEHEHAQLQRVRRVYEHVRYVCGGFQRRDAPSMRGNRKPNWFG